MCCFILQLFWESTISWAKLIFLFIDFLLFVYHQNFSTNWFFSHYFRKSSNFVFSIFHVSQQTWIKKTINSTKISKKFFLISLCVVSFFNYFEDVPFHELIFLFIDFLLFVYHQNFSTNWFFSHYFRKSSNFVFSIFHVSQQTWIKKTINSTKISKKFFLISLCVVSFFNYFEWVPFHELSLFFYSLIFFFLCTIKTFPQIDFFLTISGNHQILFFQFFMYHNRHELKKQSIQQKYQKNSFLLVCVLFHCSIILRTYHFMS